MSGDEGPSRPRWMNLDRFKYDPGTSNVVSNSPALATAPSLRSRSLPALKGSIRTPPARASPGASPGKKRKLLEAGGDGVHGGQNDEREDALGRNATGATPSPSKRTLARSRSSTPSKYAPPSTYAHLSLLPDAIAPNLLVLFVGLNPGVETARTGHAYAHPSNLFWKLMYSSGVLPERCTADEDRTLPARFQLGLTNIVARPSRNGAELKPAELDDGVAVLEAKARQWRPEVMCMVGKGIWESVVRVRARQGRRKPVFTYGWQSEDCNMGIMGEDDDTAVADGVRVDPDWKGARVFVASSTSGLAATLRPAEKEAIWRQLGEWVQIRRTEMKEEKEKEKEKEKVKEKG